MTGPDYQRAYEADAERAAVEAFRAARRHEFPQPSYFAVCLFGAVMAFCMVMA